jgi:cytoskeletal protein CcmA (bactofilin family)
VVIEGKLIGNLIASGKVEITSTGVFFGNPIMKDVDFTLKKGGIF